VIFKIGKHIFEGKRYDVGNKHGFLEATVETALKRSDLRDAFLQYLVKLVEKEVGSLREVAAGRE
jgi:UTP--glucose-1-phosphate uridylyltransferase